MPDSRPFQILKRIAIGALNLLLYVVFIAGVIAYFVEPMVPALLVMLALVIYVALATYIYPPFGEFLNKGRSTDLLDPPPGQKEFLATFPPKKNTTKDDEKL